MIVKDTLITWRHNNRLFDKDGNCTVVGTTCLIYNIENDKPGQEELFLLASAATELAIGDQYNKETGRRLSLQRALASLGLPKEFRSEVWEKYRTMGKNPRWETTKKSKLQSKEKTGS